MLKRGNGGGGGGKTLEDEDNVKEMKVYVGFVEGGRGLGDECKIDIVTGSAVVLGVGDFSQSGFFECIQSLVFFFTVWFF